MQYDFTLPPNGGQMLDVKGKFFKYKTGAGAIRVKTNKGGFVDLLPGQGIWNTEFSSLIIQDRSGVNNAGVILAGEFDFHDDRISGSVEVIDGGRNRTAANMAFGMSTYQVPVSGQFIATQIFNPLGSGVNVIVESIKTSTVTAFTGGIGVSFVPAGGSLASLSGNGYSKLAGGSVSKAQNRNGSYASAPNPGNGYPQIWGFASGTANAEASYKFTEPLVVPPNYGVILWVNNSATAGVDLSASFEFYEQAIGT